jgi:hypothetical protein
MAFQIRVAATCRLVNRSTGSTPGRLFQISTSRNPGHLAASAANSCGLLKVSVPFFALLDLLRGSQDGDVVVGVNRECHKVPFFGFYSSMTFIPLVGDTCK